MAPRPAIVSEFLSGKRFAVAGVSRQPNQPANAIFTKLRDSGFGVFGEAVRECDTLGIQRIVGGCPLMYCDPVDPAHRCFRWLLGLTGRVPR